MTTTSRAAVEAAPAVRTVAVGTDGSETATKAVEFAVDFARQCGAQLVVASSYKPVSEARLAKEADETPAELQWTVSPTEEVEAVLRDAEARGKGAGLRVSSEARTGDPARVLCEIAADHAADVLVVGSKGMNRKHLPSVPNSVSHQAPCSVMIVKTT
jgi:nucleotide-binding universal stress UspA family protein